MKISYYDLLELIKKGEEPDLIKLVMNCGERYYQAFYDYGEFSYYGLSENDENEDENFKYYLADTLLESEMFDDNIEIIEQPKKIEKIGVWYSLYNLHDLENIKEITDTMCRELKNKLNEIIDYINEKGQNENNN